MRFAARQPVFTRNMGLFGYEILFRAGFESVARFQDSDQATFATLDNSILWGLDQLCGDKLALVNCTRSALTNRLIELLPPSRTVIEILEDVVPDDEVLEACRALKQKGYRIALDDVSSLREVQAYLGLTDIVKVDFRLTSLLQQRVLAREISRHHLVALAEKVEDANEHRRAMDMGYELFQGFFYQRPEIVQRRNICVTHMNCMRLLSAVQQGELERDLITELIHGEPSLALRLLRYLNSFAFAFHFEVTSIRHALELLGEDEIRKWVLVCAVTENCIQKPSELVLWALVRARFCELVAEAIGDSLSGAFWMGMTSAFPALLEIPLPTLLRQLPIPHAVKQALGGEAGIYRDVLELLTSYERGDWQTCTARAQSIGISEGATSALYLNALDWARLITSESGRTSTDRSPSESFASFHRPDSVTSASASPTTSDKP